MKNPTVTLEKLEHKQACESGITYYKAHWTEAPTLSVCLRQLVEDGHIDWAEWLLRFSPPALQQYKEATAAALQQYEEAAAPAWQQVIAELEKGE